MTLSALGKIQEVEEAEAGNGELLMKMMAQQEEKMIDGERDQPTAKKAAPPARTRTALGKCRHLGKSHCDFSGVGSLFQDPARCVWL